MSHKVDKKRHRANVKQGIRRMKRRYLVLTRNNEIVPDNFDREVQDPDRKDTLTRLTRRLARRQVFMPLYPAIRDKV